LTQWLYHAGQVARELPAAVAASGGNPLAALTLPNLIDDVTEAIVLHPDALEYECRFECIPAAVVYRPARVTPWPVMRGAQTARVVGPSGEEIYTDEYGRVKVKFNWDREGKFDENSSCWIRVSQGMAGGQYGMMFLPRVGQEVIVDFLEGDPDQPIIVGRVFNADHMPRTRCPMKRPRASSKRGAARAVKGPTRFASRISRTVNRSSSMPRRICTSGPRTTGWRPSGPIAIWTWAMIGSSRSRRITA
jgi:uncharacterized protein involved in type VI secretion and phage assembly